MKNVLSMVLVIFGFVEALNGQATSHMVAPLLQQQLQESGVVADQLRHFMLQHVQPLALPSTAQAWNQQAADIRARTLSVIYRGWPQAWIDSPPRFEKVNVIERPGYRIIRMRFEIVPGFFSTALLYEPAHLAGKVPAILDVNGHGPGGKAVEHKQKRCINQVRRGMIALSLEWFDFGELANEGNSHDLLNLLDLEGKEGMGLFYLEMRRGLDYLYEDPDVDRSRIGVTGLSGGGWQTILLSSLDTRVGAAVPVAGFSSLTTAIEHPNYAGDAEQNAPDVRETGDYALLDALRAPRPTLLIYNDMDDCCFRAGIVKQGVYTDIEPYYGLYGKPDDLQWFEDQIPGTHNYQIDSRERSYEFFDSVFHIQASSKEDPDTDAEVRTYDDLVVGLPTDNLTILGLAQLLARSIHHEIPAQPTSEWIQSQRDLLRKDVRYKPVSVTHAWPIQATHENRVETHSYCFEFSNGLSATGVLFRSLTAPESGPTTVIVSDPGMPSTVDDVADDVDRGQRVLVLDPLFFGENVPGPTKAATPEFAALLNTLGERPLGIEASQMTAVVRWLSENLDHGTPSAGSAAVNKSASVSPVRMVTIGARAETIAAIASALEPQLFTTFDARQSIASLGDLYVHPDAYRGDPEMFCLNLYRDFDFNTLALLAAPVKENLSATAPERIFWH